MRSQASSRKKPLRLVRIIKAPIQALQRAKDMYLKSITSFSATYNRPRMIIEDANRMIKISTNQSSHQVPGGLTRASSSFVAELGRDMTRKRDLNLQRCVSRKGVPRSCSVAMGRIDEDRVSSFREDLILFKKMLVATNIDSRLSKSNKNAG